MLSPEIYHELWSALGGKITRILGPRVYFLLKGWYF